MNGFILESRSILNSPIWDKPPLYFKVWHYLLLKAQHKDNGNLKRGQLVTSIPEIIEACSYSVGFRKFKPSKKAIWDILEWMRTPYEGNAEGNDESNDEGNDESRMIVTTKVTRGLLITIVKYSVYQAFENYKSNGEGNAKETTKVTMKEQRKEHEGEHQIKESINRNNNNKSPLPPFDERASNLDNFNSMLEAGEYEDAEYLNTNADLVGKLRDWFDYKDHLSPKAKNHYGTKRGLSTFVKIAVANAKKFGVGRVCEVIDHAIASNWMGVVWEELTKGSKTVRFSGTDQEYVQRPVSERARQLFGGG